MRYLTQCVLSFKVYAVAQLKVGLFWTLSPAKKEVRSAAGGLLDFLVLPLLPEVNLEFFPW